MNLIFTSTDSKPRTLFERKCTKNFHLIINQSGVEPPLVGFEKIHNK